jgi:hypothetical protein
MADRQMPRLIARKAAGALILWGTVGLICLQALFHTAFGAAT